MLSPLHLNETLFFNVVNVILFIIGLFGLIVGNLTILNDLPLKNYQARIVGSLFILPILSTALGFAHWFDRLPAVLSIISALAYLYFATPPSELKTNQFWFVAIIPAITLYAIVYIITVLTDIWNLVFNFFHNLSFSDVISTILIIIIFEFLIPVVIAFLTNKVIPVVTSKNKSVVFALPASLFYFQGAMTGWILPSIDAIEFPNVPHPKGLIEFGIAHTLVGLSLFISVALAGWFGTKMNKKERTYSSEKWGVSEILCKWALIRPTIFKSNG